MWIIIMKIYTECDRKSVCSSSPEGWCFRWLLKDKIWVYQIDREVHSGERDGHLWRPGLKSSLALPMTV